MTPGIIVAFCAFGFTLLCALCGGVWWMSALSSKLNHYIENFNDHKDHCDDKDDDNSSQSKEQIRLSTKVEKIEREISEIFKRINRTAE